MSKVRVARKAISKALAEIRRQGMHPTWLGKKEIAKEVKSTRRAIAKRGRAEKVSQDIAKTRAVLRSLPRSMPTARKWVREDIEKMHARRVRLGSGRRREAAIKRITDRSVGRRMTKPEQKAMRKLTTKPKMYTTYDRRGRPIKVTIPED